MSNEYNFNIKSADSNYQFKLVPTNNPKPGVVIGGIAYSVRPRSRQERQAIDLFLKSAQGGEPSTIKEFASNLKNMPQIQTVTLTKHKAHLVGIATLIPPDPLKKSEVESSLIPKIPTTSGPVQPTHIMQRMKDLGIKGASIAVINRGQIEWTAGYGDLEKSPLAQAGSTSKMVNGLVVLSLIDQCQKAEAMGIPSGLANDQVITLDTDVSTLIDPDLWRSIDPNQITAGNNPKLTIRDLLAHTGGIPGHGGFDGYPQVAKITEEITTLKEEIHTTKLLKPSIKTASDIENLERRLEKCKKALDNAHKGQIPNTDQILKGEGNSPQVKIEWAPNSRWQYSGGGSTVLQKIVENLTGQEYPTVVKERVLSKFDANESTFQPADDAVVAGKDIDGDPLPGGWNKFPEYAAAGLWSNSTELAKVVIGIQNILQEAPNSLINPDLAGEMITPEISGVPGALGMFVEQTPQSTYFFHNGSTLGYRCMALGNTEGMGAVVMTNSVSGEHLIDEIIPAIMKAYNWPDADTLPMFRPALGPHELAAIEETTSIDEAIWNSYVGDYEFIEEGEIHSVNVSTLDGKIMVKVDKDPSFAVKPLTDSMGLYRQSINGPQNVIRFTRSPSGVVEDLILFGAKHQRKPLPQ